MEHVSDGEKYRNDMAERALRAASSGSTQETEEWKGQDPYYPKPSTPSETKHPNRTKKTKAPIADMLKDFHLAIERVSLVTRYGNSQPGRSLGSWRDVPDFENEYRNAKARHAISGLVEDNDRESGIEHLAHDAWNALALLQFKLEKSEETGVDEWWKR